MAYDIQTLIHRIDERLAKLNMTDRAASIEATGSPDAIRYIKKRNAWPSSTRLAQLAVTLRASPNFLMGRSRKNDWEGSQTVSRDSPEWQERMMEALDQLYNYTDSDGHRPDNGVDISEDAEGDIPVFESHFRKFETFSAIDGTEIDVQVASVDGSKINKGLTTPAGSTVSAFAFLNALEGMEPLVKIGELVFAESKKLPAGGELCVVRLFTNETEADPYLWDYFIAYFIKRTKKSAVFRQAANSIEFELPEGREFRLNRVPSVNELWGV